MIGLVQQAAAANCTGADGRPEPDWLVSSEPVPGFYTGTGVAEKADISFSQQRQLARQNALKDLGSSIEVLVRSRLQITDTSSSQGQTQSDFESISEAVSEVLLADIKIVDSWVDSTSCTLWMQVAAPREKVKQNRTRATALSALGMLRTRLQLANEIGELGQRKESLAQAYALLDKIDFSLISDGSTRAALSLRLDEIKAKLASDASAQASGSAALNDLSDLRDEARAILAKNRPQANSAYARARTAHANRLPELAFGPSSDFAGEQAYWQWSQLAQDFGFACEARDLLQELSRKTTDAQWQERSETSLNGLDCNTQQRVFATWRSLLFDQEVKIACGLRLQERWSDWPRACQELRKRAIEHGARSVSAATNAERNMSCLSRSCASKGQVLLIALGNGEVNQRDNAKNPNGEDFRYQGEVGLAIAQGTSLNFVDKFSGIGGWNPVSQTMALEVLALQLLRRTEKKFVDVR
ncbi:MAG: LPP20 family lipoprotein [Oceanococcus sp.]